MAYTYKPLHDPTSQIRLARWLGLKYPAASGIQKWSLSVHDVSNAPSYTTISYTWGDSSDKVAIDVDGADLQVPRNLCKAFYHLFSRSLADLREVPDRGFFWADAICINQHDLHEKEKQVQQMTGIYARAAGSVAWLGEGLQSTMQSLRDMKLQPLKRSEEWKRYDVWLALDEVQDAFEDPELLALREIFKHPLWTRAWIVQEVIAPKTLHFLYGTVTFHALQMLSITFGMMWLQWPESQAAHRTLSYRRDHHMALITEQRLNLELWRFLSDVRSFYDATDPRDLIYAILNIAEGHSITPDYLASYSSACVKVARELVKSQGILFVLERCDKEWLGFADKIAWTLPSWVPDWRRKSSPVIEQSSASEPAEKEIARLQTETLELKCHLLGAIVAVLECEFSGHSEHHPSTAICLNLKDQRRIKCAARNEIEAAVDFGMNPMRDRDLRPGTSGALDGDKSSTSDIKTDLDRSMDADKSTEAGDPTDVDSASEFIETQFAVGCLLNAQQGDYICAVHWFEETYHLLRLGDRNSNGHYRFKGHLNKQVRNLCWDCINAQTEKPSLRDCDHVSQRSTRSFVEDFAPEQTTFTLY